MSLDDKFHPSYNDLNEPYDKDLKQKLVEGGIKNSKNFPRIFYEFSLIFLGVDNLLAHHMAHLFIRDPLVIYRDKLSIDDEKFSDHFEVTSPKNNNIIFRTYNQPTGKPSASNPLHPIQASDGVSSSARWKCS